MKRMMLLSVLIGMGMLLSVNGQERQGPPNMQDMQQRRQQMMNDLKKELKLTKDQDAKFDQIYKEADEKMAAARQNAGEDRTAMRTKMQEINADRDKKVENLLKPDQLKKFQEYQKKQAEMRQNRQGGGGGGFR
jgi:ABC-type transporter Mla subunit MlaD